MLDPSILEQLSGHFAALTSDFTFALSPSQHDRQDELRSFLSDLADASARLRVEERGTPVQGVRFELLRNGTATGVGFRGIPGGHEFTSLILSILNADGLGKLPDEGIKKRVRALKGPISLRTYISLSCTNCPDVVQALNQMALLNPQISHDMVDGGLAEEEIEKLNVQAVPSVFSGDDLLHVGKSNFGELLERLEERFGSSAGDESESMAPAEPKEYDVVVIGGGPAGCSAAIYSARKGLKTAIVAQKMGGQVAETLGIENLVSVTYTEGARLTADLEKHVRAYAIDLLEHRKVLEIKNGPKKEVHLQGGELLRTPALIIATGARWRELGIPGEKEYLGRGVAFCPHCDGPFYKGRRVAVIGGGNSGVEAVIDLAGICSHVTLVEYLDVLKADDVLVKNMRALPNVDVVLSARVTEIVGNGEGVTGLRYQNRATEETHELQMDGVFVQIGLVPNSALVKDLVEVNRFGEIVVDDRCRTNTAGVYAAGDVTTVAWKQIVIATGEGAKAALAAFEDRIRAA